jgi:hypothetical protein
LGENSILYTEERKFGSAAVAEAFKLVTGVRITEETHG